MDNSKIQAFSNWTHIGGCTFSESIQERAADPDIFTKPHINEVVDERKSILLSKEDSSECCEFYIKIIPNYKIQAVSFVCNVVKAEIFLGHIKEYLETIYGVLVDEPDDQFKTYRYDVEIEKSGITDLTLRFLTNSSDVCIFGLILHTSPNPNGVTTLLPSSCCNNADMLEKSRRKIDGVPDKFEKLFEMITKRNQSTLDQNMKQKMDIFSSESKISAGETHNQTLESLKLHIDERFKKIEIQIQKYLEDIDRRQNQKLDKILHILEKHK